MLDKLNVEFEEMDMEQLQEEVEGGLTSSIFNGISPIFLLK